MKQQSDPRLLVLYYAATVIFLVLDYGFSVNVRIAALEAFPGLRAAYYLAIFACLGLMLWRPAWASAIGVVESTLTLALLIINMWLQIMGFSYSDDGLTAAPVGVAEIINFLLSGSVAYYAWNRGMQQLFGPRK